ncbi:MAG TPA: protein kinase [Bryobacteraceae bacterium]|nr:protein kinase [Bryobacteraceae bacterium]
MQIGKYTVTAEIGSGGFGRVYSATDPSVGRTVAIKVMNAPDDASIVRRFRSEAKTVANLHHRNIVTVYEFGEQSGVPYLVMEYLEGVTLQSLIGQGSVALLEKLEIMVEAAEGLKYAHEHGVTHRDVKPGNIMRLVDGSVKIMDFGIARIAAEGTMGHTAAGLVVGSMRYMAPEQFRGTADAMSDIFSYGITFFELLAGYNPFASPDPAISIYLITSTDAPSLRSVVPEYSEALDAVVARLLARSREVRYSRFDDVLLDLRPLLMEARRRHGAALYTQAGQLLATGQLELASATVRKVLDLDPMHTAAAALRLQIDQALQHRDVITHVAPMLERAERELSERRSEEAASILAGVPTMAQRIPELQARLQEAATQIARMRASERLLVAARQGLAQDDLTTAFRAASEAVVGDPGNEAANHLLETVRTRMATRDAQRRFQEEIARVNGLLQVGKTDEASAAIAGLDASVRGTPEVAALRKYAEEQKAREDRAQKLALGMAGAGALLNQRKYDEAIGAIDRLAAEYPESAELRALRRHAEERRAAEARIPTVEATRPVALPVASKPAAPKPAAPSDVASAVPTPERKTSPTVWIGVSLLAVAGVLFLVLRPHPAPVAPRAPATSTSPATPTMPLGVAALSGPEKAIAGTSYEMALQATGGTPPIRWSVPTASLPAGLALDPARGVIAGVPAAVGRFAFLVTAVDAAGQSASRDVVVLVEAPAKTEPEAAAKGKPVATAALAPPCQVAKFVLEQYGDALSGELVWSGSLGSRERLSIENRRASIGRVQGDVLPQNVPLRISVSPATVKLVSAPSAANCWASGLAIQNGASATSEIHIKWQVFQP